MTTEATSIRHRRSLVALVIVSPVVIALAGVIALAVATAAAPDRLSASADTGRPSPLVGLIVLPFVLAIAGIGYSVLRRPANVGSARAVRAVASTVLGLSGFVTVGLIGTTVVRGSGRESELWIPLAFAIGLAGVLDALAVRLLPVSQASSVSSGGGAGGTDGAQRSPSGRGASTRSSWTGVAPADLAVVAGVLGVLGAIGSVAVVLGLAIGPWGFAALAIPLGIGAVLSALAWRVRIDRVGVRATGVFGYPVVRIPLDSVAGAGVVRVVPIGDFGGFGVRLRPGVTAIVTRAGDALDIVRVDGSHVFVTVDAAADAASTLVALTGGR